MNISMLFDIDDLGTNIASALRSNPDIGNVSLDPGSSSWVLKGRPYLHPMTNIDPSPSLRHPDSWNFPARPLIIKPWVGKTSSNGYETLSDADIAAHGDTLHRPSGLVYHSSVPADMAKLELLPEYSSPHQSCDEDWRKYLADEPFSTGMDDDDHGLDDAAAGSPLEFTYPSPDKVENSNTSDHFASEQLSFSAVPNFPTHSQTSLFDSMSLAENPPSTIPSVPLLVIPSPEHTSFAVDLQEDTPRHSDTVCIPSGTYASLMELTPPAFDFGSARFSSLEAPSRPPTGSAHVSPADSPTHSPLRRGRSPTVSRRGLSGWGDSQYLQVPTPAVIGRCRKRVRSPTNSPSSSVRRPHTISPLSLTQDSEETTSTHDSKRSKTSKGFSSRTLRSVSVAKVVHHESEPDELGVVEDDSDSDDYRPSRSSSRSIDSGVASSFSAALPLLQDVRPVVSKQKSTSSRRGKGKAKGSAALALAVVTQLGAGAKGSVKSEPCDDGDPLTLYREGRYGIRKKKNNPIPLPVPVPNLNKKSRGRKVPYVAASAAVIKVESEDRSPSAEALTEDQGSASSVVAESTDSKNSGRSRRKMARVPTPVASIDQAGNRTYVCAVAGCGKCFVRGEHLKRHIRSIHTYDKPHPCPFQGCDKSFSRRDNLGQHVRIHLQA